jgi:hypothetical protein
MMSRRWSIVLIISTVLFTLAYAIKLTRFYRDWYAMPISLHKVLSANLAFVKGGWPSWLFGVLLLVGMASNWFVAKKRENQIK